MAGLILALGYPVKGQSPFEWLISGVDSLYQDKIKKGLVLSIEDAFNPEKQRLGSTRPFCIPVENDNGRGGWYLTGMSSSPRMETLYFSVKPKGDKSFLDPVDRVRRDFGIPAAIRQLNTAGIKHGTSMLTQAPLNHVPIEEHYQRGGRLHLGDAASFDSASPLDALLITHMLHLQEMVIKSQPDFTQYLALRLRPGAAWEGRRPEKLTSSEWKDEPLQQTLDRALSAIKLTGDVPGRPSVLQLYAYLQANLDPYSADQVYEQLWDDEHSKVNPTDTLTYKAGPFPAPITVTRDYIKAGDAYHTFIEVSDFTGGDRAEPGFFDDIKLKWESGSFISHFSDWRIQGAWLQEHGWQIAADVLDQRNDGTVFRPRREKQLEKAQDTYENVANSGLSFRASWHIRLTSGTPNYLAWMVKDMLSEMIEAGMAGFHVRGSSRQVKLLERSIGCAVR
jgi:hypothetical protein